MGGFSNIVPPNPNLTTQFIDTSAPPPVVPPGILAPGAALPAPPPVPVPAQAATEDPNAPVPGQIKYGILGKLLGQKHSQELEDHYKLLDHKMGLIHDAMFNPNSKMPDEEFLKHNNDLAKMVGHPEVGQAIKANAERFLATKKAKAALANVNATQAPANQGMGVPNMGQPSAAAGPSPGLPQPPGAAPVPFGDGDQAGGPPPPAQIPPQVRAQSIQGGSGYGQPSPTPNYGILSREEMGRQAGLAQVAEKFPLMQREAELKQQIREQLIAQGRDQLHLSGEVLADWVNSHPISKLMSAGPGTNVFNSMGQLVGTGGPQHMEVLEGGKGVIIPNTPPPGMPAMPGSAAATGTPGTTSAQPTIIQGNPPRLSEPEVNALSAVERTAAAHKIPFDRTLNPRDPYAQLPLQYHREARALIAQEKADPETRDLRIQSMTAMNAMRAVQQQMAQVHMDNMRFQRSDRSHMDSQRELDAMAKPISDRVSRFGTIQDNLAQHSQVGDSQVAPELITVMSGGAGSGVRVNNSEMDAITGSRTLSQRLQAKANLITRDPKQGAQFTDSERQQIQAILNVAAKKAVAKQDAVLQGYRDVVGSDDPTQHRKIVQGVRDKLARIDQGKDEPMTPPPGKMVVRDKRDGQTGMIDNKDFDSKTMEVVKSGG